MKQAVGIIDAPPMRRKRKFKKWIKAENWEQVERWKSNSPALEWENNEPFPLEIFSRSRLSSMTAPSQLVPSQSTGPLQPKLTLPQSQLVYLKNDLMIDPLPPHDPLDWPFDQLHDWQIFFIRLIVVSNSQIWEVLSYLTSPCFVREHSARNLKFIKLKCSVKFSESL